MGQAAAIARLGDVAAPFHLEATVRVLQRRPINRVDTWAHARYRRVLQTPHGLVGLDVGNHGTIGAPDLRYRLHAAQRLPSQTRGAVLQTARKMLGLDLDPGPLERLANIDHRLRVVALALRGMRPPRFASLFEAFASVVPFQQLSLDAGMAIVGRMVQRFGQQIEWHGQRAHAFPSVDSIAEARIDALRRCGLSARKAEALRAIARAIDGGELRETALQGMSTADALAALRSLAGIGPWSASLVLLRGLGRLDVFPPGDVGAARGLRSLLRLDAHAPLDPLIDSFGDLRGYLYFYALGGSLLARGLIAR